MSTPAGWYDAGAPGRLRWWDGAQWTEHECDAPQPVSPSAPQPAVVAAAPVQAGVAMGWYAVPGTSETRWWNGRDWTAYSIRAGRPRGDWYAVEPPGIGYAFGPLFLVLGALLLLTSRLAEIPNYSGIGIMAVGAFWLSAAVALTIVRGRPAPASAPLGFDVVQPLPGQIEGPAAGWVPVTAKISRWWSGARWGEYILEADRVRPTHGGARSYRAAMILAFVLIGLGALALIAGIVLMAADPSGAPVWLGAAALGAGIAFVVIGGVILPVIRYRKPAFVVPEHPPMRLG